MHDPFMYGTGHNPYASFEFYYFIVGVVSHHLQSPTQTHVYLLPIRPIVFTAWPHYKSRTWLLHQNNPIPDPESGNGEQNNGNNKSRRKGTKRKHDVFEGNILCANIVEQKERAER